MRCFNSELFLLFSSNLCADVVYVSLSVDGRRQVFACRGSKITGRGLIGSPDLHESHMCPWKM